MPHCGLDVAYLQHCSIPKPAVHQAVGTGDSFLAKVLEVSFLQYIAERWLSGSNTEVSDILIIHVCSKVLDIHRSRCEPKVPSRLLKNLQKLSSLKKLGWLHASPVERTASCYNHRISDQCLSIFRTRASSRRI